MHFSPELRDGVTAGRITLSFRLWQRPKVKVGGQYATAAVRIEIDSIEMVPFSSFVGAPRTRGRSTTTRSCTASSSTSFRKERAAREAVSSAGVHSFRIRTQWGQVRARIRFSVSPRQSSSSLMPRLRILPPVRRFSTELPQPTRWLQTQARASRRNRRHLARFRPSPGHIPPARAQCLSVPHKGPLVERRRFGGR